MRWLRCAGLLLGVSLPAYGQQDGGAGIIKIDKIEVTGSNIRRADIETALPLQVITREDIERSGAISAAALLSQVSANLVGRTDVPYNTYWVPNRVFFWGKWLKFGPAYDPHAKVSGYGYRKILFRKGTARYVVKSEHEDISAQEPYGWLKHPYDHYSMPTVSAWVASSSAVTSCSEPSALPRPRGVRTWS